MPRVQLLTPFDHAVGGRRLLDDLRADLQGHHFDELKLVVAYAKAGPLIRLKRDLTAFRAAGKSLSVIVGVDQNGTSREAMELILELFPEAYTTREAGITFHPKFYVFRGPALARAYIGSNNLTVGGTETNFEASVAIDYELPDEHVGAAEFSNAWNQLLPANCPATEALTRASLDALVAQNVVLTEAAMRKRGGFSGGAVGTPKAKSGLLLRPPSALPAGVMVNLPTGLVAGAAAPARPNPLPTGGHVLHIRPHTNGEIHLSTTAARQRPAFFGLPFTGLAQPKKAGNPAYPYRDPRPLVDFRVIGAGGAELYRELNHPLYMINYGQNAELRITSSGVARASPAMSIMVMKPSTRAGVEYDITVHTPASPEYAAWEALAVQPMPGGRRFGWI